MLPARHSLTISSVQSTFAVRPSEVTFNVNALVWHSTISFWGDSSFSQREVYGKRHAHASGSSSIMNWYLLWKAVQAQPPHAEWTALKSVPHKQTFRKQHEKVMKKKRIHLGCLLQKAHLNVLKKQALLMQTSVFVVFFLFYAIPPRLHIAVVQT